MKKKKRALALGLAATQLAAFAPMYSQVAFAANDATAISSVAKATVDANKAGDGKNSWATNGSHVSAVNFDSATKICAITADFKSMKEANQDTTGTAGGATGKKSFPLLVTFDAPVKTYDPNDKSTAYGQYGFNEGDAGEHDWCKDTESENTAIIWVDDTWDGKVLKFTFSGGDTYYFAVNTASKITGVAKPTSISGTSKDWAGNIEFVNDLTYNDTDKTCKITANIGKMKKADQEGTDGKTNIESFPIVVTFDAPIPANVAYGEYKINTGDTGVIDWCTGTGENTAVFWVDASWVDATDGVTFTLNGIDYTFTVEDVKEKITSVVAPPTVDGLEADAAKPTLGSITPATDHYEAELAITKTSDGSAVTDANLAAGNYTATITFTPADGYAFGDNVFNAYTTADWTVGTPDTDTGAVTCTKTFKVGTVEDTDLVDADIDLSTIEAGLANLKVGDGVPAFTLTSTKVEVVAASSGIYDGATKVSTATFETAKDYTAKITLKPKAGNKFGATLPTVSGWTAGTVDGDGAVTYTRTAAVTVGEAEATDAEKVAAAMTAAQAALDDFTATNETTAAAVLKAVTDAIAATETEVTAAWDGTNGFTLNEATNKDRGTITGTINLTSGTETDTITVNLTIEKLPAVAITGATVTLASGTYTYNGTEQKPTVQSVVLSDGTTTLATGDYKVTYSDNINAGTAAKVIVTGVEANGYTGTASATFTIEKAAPTATAPTTIKLEKDTTEEQLGEFVIANPTGNTPGTWAFADAAAVVTSIGSTAENGTFSANLNFTPTDVNNYNPVENVSATITVVAAGTIKDIAGATVTLTSGQNFTYDGTEKKPTVASVKFTPEGGSETTLTADNDYTISYSNNVNAGEATVTITGTGAYKGTATAKFTIAKAEPTITTNPTVEVSRTATADTLNAMVIENPDDNPAGTWTFSNATTAAAALATAVADSASTFTADLVFTPTDQDNYTTKTVSATINIKELVSISSATVEVDATTDLTYTGSAITPDVTVTLDANTLVEDTDYTVEYSNNINAGTATVTITGKGDYTGTATANFTIAKAAQTMAAPVATYNADTKKITVTSPVTGAKYLCNTSTSAPTTADLDASSATEFAITADGTYYVWAYLPAADANHTDSDVVKSAAIVVKTTSDTPDTPVTPTAQAAPAAPTYKSRSNTIITLNTIAANANGAPAEYSKDGKKWQSSPSFTGLSKNTSYTFYARYAAIEGFAASPASKGTVIKTTNTSSSGGSSGGSSWRPSYSGGSSSSGSDPADSSSSTTPNITNDTADDIDDVIDTTPSAANLSKITDSAEDVEKALKDISKPTVIEKRAATVLEAAIEEAKKAVTTADKATCAENIQLIMKALSTEAPKVRGDADNSGKVDSADVLLSVLNFRKYRTNAAGQLFTAVTMGVTDKTALNTNDILAFIKAFRTR